MECKTKAIAEEYHIKKKTTIKNNKKAYIKQVVKERIRNKNQNNIKSYYHSKTTSQATTENK